MLSAAVARYVALHRSLGFQFRQQRTLLQNFAAFAERRGTQFVRTSLAIEWAAQAPSPAQRHLPGDDHQRAALPPGAGQCPRRPP